MSGRPFLRQFSSVAARISLDGSSGAAPGPEVACRCLTAYSSTRAHSGGGVVVVVVGCDAIADGVFYFSFSSNRCLVLLYVDE